MVECNATSKMVYQKVRKEHCCEPHDSCGNSHVSVLNKWQQIFRDILAHAEPNAHKYDGFEPVLLGGGSTMFIRCDSESIFREGK
jgi:hypothetical protein